MQKLSQLHVISIVYLLGTKACALLPLLLKMPYRIDDGFNNNQLSLNTVTALEAVQNEVKLLSPGFFLPFPPVLSGQSLFRKKGSITSCIVEREPVWYSG